jgi:hypothetical protein
LEASLTAYQSMKGNSITCILNHKAFESKLWRWTLEALSLDRFNVAFWAESRRFAYVAAGLRDVSTSFVSTACRAWQRRLDKILSGLFSLTSRRRINTGARSLTSKGVYSFRAEFTGLFEMDKNRTADNELNRRCGLAADYVSRQRRHSRRRPRGTATRGPYPGAAAGNQFLGRSHSLDSRRTTPSLYRSR